MSTDIYYRFNETRSSPPSHVVPIVMSGYGNEGTHHHQHNPFLYYITVENWRKLFLLRMKIWKILSLTYKTQRKWERRERLKNAWTFFYIVENWKLSGDFHLVVKSIATHSSEAIKFPRTREQSWWWQSALTYLHHRLLLSWGLCFAPRFNHMMIIFTYLLNSSKTTHFKDYQSYVILNCSCTKPI